MEQMGREFRAKTVFVGHCVMKICLKMMIVFCSPLGSQQAFCGPLFGGNTSAYHDTTSKICKMFTFRSMRFSIHVRMGKFLCESCLYLMATRFCRVAPKMKSSLLLETVRFTDEGQSLLNFCKPSPSILRVSDNIVLATSSSFFALVVATRPSFRDRHDAAMDIAFVSVICADLESFLFHWRYCSIRTASTYARRRNLRAWLLSGVTRCSIPR